MKPQYSSVAVYLPGFLEPLFQPQIPEGLPIVPNDFNMNNPIVNADQVYFWLGDRFIEAKLLPKKIDSKILRKNSLKEDFVKKSTELIATDLMRAEGGMKDVQDFYSLTGLSRIIDFSKVEDEENIFRIEEKLSGDGSLWKFIDEFNELAMSIPPEMISDNALRRYGRTKTLAGAIRHYMPIGEAKTRCFIKDKGLEESLKLAARLYDSGHHAKLLMSGPFGTVSGKRAYR